MTPETARLTRGPKLPGALFAAVLGLGYLAAITNLFFTMQMADLKPGMSRSDIVAHFHGDRSVTRLSKMASGPMRKNLKSDAELQAIFKWVNAGAREQDYDPVGEILEDRCEKCHSSTGKMSGSPLTTFEEVSEFTKPDPGVSKERLALLSHQHMFGMGLLCFATSLILWRQTSYSNRTKAALTVFGFLGMTLDISGWWLTKLFAAFSHQILIGGTMTGMFFGLSIFLIWRDFLFGKTVLDDGTQISK